MPVIVADPSCQEELISSRSYTKKFPSPLLTNRILPCDITSHTEILKEFVVFGIGLKLLPSFSTSGRGINSAKQKYILNYLLYICPNKQVTGFYVQVTVHRDKLRKKQRTRCIKYPKVILSKNSTCSGIFCAHHRELSTVHTATGTFHAGYMTAT